MAHQTAALDTAAELLRGAYTGGQIAPLRQFFTADDAARAYEVQDINSRVWASRGRRPIGRKIGLTSRAIQAQLGVDQPNHGVLFADMAMTDGGEIPGTARFLQPRVEAEVALVMERDLALTDATVEDVIRCCAYASAAIEIVDSRMTDWNITFADMIADNGCAAGYVLSPVARPLRDLDLLTCGMVMEVNGRVVSLGAGAACLGHPLRAAAWLARALARTDRALAAGDVILTGALGPMAAVGPRDVVQVSIGGLGKVRVAFADANRD